jgi:hypothetical protein
VFVDWNVAEARCDGRDYAEIGCRVFYGHPAGDIHEHVIAQHEHSDSLLDHRHQQNNAEAHDATGLRHMPLLLLIAETSHLVASDGEIPTNLWSDRFAGRAFSDDINDIVPFGKVSAAREIIMVYYAHRRR